MLLTLSKPEDVYRRAKELYEQHIRAQVENVHDGKIIMSRMAIINAIAAEVRQMNRF